MDVSVCRPHSPHNVTDTGIIRWLVHTYGVWHLQGSVEKFISEFILQYRCLHSKCLMIDLFLTQTLCPILCPMTYLIRHFIFIF